MALALLSLVSCAQQAWRLGAIVLWARYHEAVSEAIARSICEITCFAI